MQNSFIGREGTIGRSLPTEKVENGKKIYKVWTDSGATTPKDWENHYSGSMGLGLSPILKNGKCLWAAIDIDNYEINIEELSIKYRETPFLFCRTKSGGVHLYLFFSKEQDGKKLIAEIEELVLICRLPPSYDKKGRLQNTEIFPKQAIKKEGQGNWINLPYFNSHNTERYCVYSGVRLSLEQFIEKIAEKKLSSLKKTLQSFVFYGAPHCLQTLLSGGITDGMRNIFLINVGVFLKKKYPDTWKEEIEKINTSKYMEPVDGKEIKNIISSLSKDLYYQCSTNLKPVCNRDICRKREFGFLTDNSPEKAIGQFTKVITEKKK